jgi:hypothetical protein
MAAEHGLRFCVAAEDGLPMLHCCGRWVPDVELLREMGPRFCIAAEDGYAKEGDRKREREKERGREREGESQG